MQDRNATKRLLLAVLLMVAICCVGISGYVILEPGWSFLDALFMTSITLTTVGYSDYEISVPAKIFTLILLLLGIGTFTYALAAVTSFIVEGHFSNAFRRKRMDKQITRLSNHCIICGAGDTGHYVIDEFQKTGWDFVVVESDEERIRELLEECSFLYVQGDATDDRVLQQAGIGNACMLITTLSLDKDNLFVVLSARRLNPDLRIIAKVVDVDASRQKIMMAGADEAVSPEAIGGLRIASLALRPQVVSFLDLMLREGGATRFEEATVRSGSRVIGKPISESQIWEETGLRIVALRRGPTGEFVYNPRADLVLEADDVLFVIGGPESIQRLRKITKDRS